MKIRIRLRALFVAGLFFTLSCAGTKRAPEPAPTAAEPKPETSSRQTPGLFLYEVRKAAATAHLMGTMHIGFGLDEVLTEDARTRLDAATRVVTEADVSAADPANLVQAALLPPERSLASILGPATWERLVQRVGTQIPPTVLDRLEPWLPTVIIGLQDLERALKELRPKAGSRLMDLELTKFAAERGKQVSHLETVAEQIAIFESVALEEQVRELASSLEAKSSDEAKVLLDSFARGDEQGLARAIFDKTQLATSPAFYERVLFERNQRWMPVIESEVSRGAFIAVGAAHLFGDRGLIAELVKRGYKVRRVG